MLRSIVKVVLKHIDESTQEVLKTTKLTINKQMITIDALERHVAKSLDLKEDFVILTGEEKGPSFQHALLDDWDLDLAIANLSIHAPLQILVATKPIDEDLKGWDVVTAVEVKYLERYGPSRTSGDFYKINQNLSFLDRLVDGLENFQLFSKERSTFRRVPYPQTKEPMTFREFQKYLDPAGRLIFRQPFLESIYHGGVNPSVRKIIWRHLLNVFPLDSTGKDRVKYLKEKSHAYSELKQKWKKEYKSEEQSGVCCELRAITTQVKKDVIRTDRNHRFYKGRDDNSNVTRLFDLLCTYAVNHPDVSYCQGMCDIASPILIVQENEAHAYLLFCAIMERLKYNFMNDGRAISTKLTHLTQLVSHFDPEFFNYMQEHQVDDLLFTYRWILLDLKREFPLNDALYCMEVMWSTLPTPIGEWRAVPLTDLRTHSHSRSHSTSSAYASPYTKLASIQPMNDDLEQVDTSTISENSNESETISISESILDKAMLIDASLANAETRSERGETISETHECPSHFDDCETNCSSDINSCGCSHIGSTDGQSEHGRPNLCQASSIDSGIVSRPMSPTRRHSGIQDNMDDVLEHAAVSSKFPPPSEFGFGNPFLMFAVLTMILQHRDTIMDMQMDFNDIMLLFNHSVRQNDVHRILRESRILFEAYINHDLQTDLDEFVFLDLPSC